MIIFFMKFHKSIFSIYWESRIPMNNNKPYAVFVFMLFVISFGFSQNMMTIPQNESQNIQNTISMAPKINEFSKKEIGASTTAIDLDNITIHTLRLYNSEVAKLNNSIIDRIYVNDNSTLWLSNSVVDNTLNLYGGVHVYLYNVTVDTIESYQYATIELVNCNITGYFEMGDYSIVTIRNSTINQLNEGSTFRVSIQDSNITYYEVSADYSPLNTVIENSNITTLYMDEYHNHYPETFVHIQHSNITNYLGLLYCWGPGSIQYSGPTGTHTFGVDLDEYTKDSIVNMAPNSYIFIGDWDLTQLSYLTNWNRIYLINGSYSLGSTTNPHRIYAYYSSVYVYTSVLSSELYGYHSSFELINSEFKNTVYQNDNSNLYLYNATINSLYTYYNTSANIIGSNITSFSFSPYLKNVTLSIVNTSIYSFRVYDSINYFKNVNITYEFYNYNSQRENQTIINVYAKYYHDTAYIYCDANITPSGILTESGETLIPENLTYSKIYFNSISIYNGTVRVSNISTATMFMLYGGTLILVNTSIYPNGGIITTSGTVDIYNSTFNGFNYYNYRFSNSNITISNSTLSTMYINNSTIAITNVSVSLTIYMIDSNVNISNALFTTMSYAILSYNTKLSLINVQISGSIYTGVNPYSGYSYIYTNTYNFDNINNYFVNVTVNNYQELILGTGTNSITMVDNVVSGNFINSTMHVENLVYSTKTYCILLYENSTMQIINSTILNSKFQFIVMRGNSRIIMKNSTVDEDIRSYDYASFVLTNSTVGYIYSYGHTTLYANTTLFDKTIYLNEYSQFTIENSTFHSYIYIKQYSTLNIRNSHFLESYYKISVYNNAKLTYINDEYNDSYPAVSVRISSSRAMNSYVKNVKLSTVYTYDVVNLTLVGCNITKLSIYSTYFTNNFTEFVENHNKYYNCTIENVYGYLGVSTMSTKVNSTGVYPNPSDYYYSEFINTNISAFYNDNCVLFNDGSISGGNNLIYGLFAYGIYQIFVPTIEAGPSVIHNEYSYHKLLQWHLEGFSLEGYILYMNGTEIDVVNTPPNVTVSIDLGTLDVGMYNYTIVIYSWYVVNVSTVIVYIHPIAAPVVTFLGSSYEITINSTDTVTLSWKAEDFSPTTYEILVNNVSVETGTWEANQTISYVFSGEPGTYTVLIKFRDAFNLETPFAITIHVLSAQNNTAQNDLLTQYALVIVVVGVTVVAVVVIYLKREKILALIRKS